eukprot:12318150-Alexandrium_andersonii.AAC.1
MGYVHHMRACARSIALAKHSPCATQHDNTPSPHTTAQCNASQLSTAQQSGAHHNTPQHISAAQHCRADLPTSARGD